MFTIRRALLAAPLAALLAAGTASAQHGGGHGGGGHAGGGHAGGGHAGGAHMGGVHPGGVHTGGVHPGGVYHTGGAYHPVYGGGYNRGIGYGGIGYGGLGYGGFGYGLGGLGYGLGGLGYGGYGMGGLGGGYYGGTYGGSSYGGGYAQPYYSTSGYTPIVVPANTYPNNFQPGIPVQPNQPAPQGAATDGTATLTVLTTEGAQVSFDGTPDDQKGTIHTYTTPVINAGAVVTVTVKMVSPSGSPLSMPLQMKGGDKTTVDLSSLR